MPSGPGHSGGTPSRSTATTCPPSTRPTGGPRNITITPPKPELRIPQPPEPFAYEPPPGYDDAVATRKAFGETLAAMADNPGLVVLDGEVSNSTHTEDFQKVAPD